jgi:hypothetical protein
LLTVHQVEVHCMVERQHVGTKMGRGKPLEKE